MMQNDHPAANGTRSGMLGHSIREAAPALLLAAIALPFLLYGLGHYSLVNGDEEIYHVIARRMVETGDWIHLYFYDEHRVYDTFMNAPLQYWARALVIAAFGSSEWTVRLLSALCAVASVLVTYRFSLQMNPRRGVAWLAGAIHLTTLQFVYLHGARTGELEPIVVLLYTALALLFLKALETRGSFVAHHVCLALLLNLKAPTVLVPLLAEAACFALLPAARPGLRRFVLHGLFVLPFGLVWHVARMIELWGPFLGVVQRMAGEASAHSNPLDVAGRASNAVFYAATVLFGAWPWSIFYPVAIASVLLDDRRRADGLGWRVVAIFVAAVFVFYCAVSKHHRWYIMPAYPLLAAFVAQWLSSLWHRSRPPAAIGLAVVALSASLVVFTRVNVTGYDPFMMKAWAIPMKTRWGGLAGLDAAWGVPLLTAVLFAVLLWLRGGWGDRLGRWLAAALALGLLGQATLRVVLPLRHVDRRSSMARLRDRLEREHAEARVRGEAILYPIETGERLEWDARFYLGDRFRIVPRGKSFLLFAKEPTADASHTPPRAHAP